MDKAAEHNLGNGWLLEQFCNKEGIERFKFSQHSTAKCITLENESVKTLRAIFKSHQ